MDNRQVLTVADLVDKGLIFPPMDGNHGEIHPKGDDFVENGIPFVMASDLNDQGDIDLTSCKFITQTQAQSLRNGYAHEGDVLLSHKATIGRTAIVPKISFPYLMLTPQVTYYRVRDTNQIDNRFLRYSFESPHFQKTLALWSDAGSTRAYIGITKQRGLKVLLPDIRCQQGIADVLSALDNKIALNNQINAELEAMAKLIYDYWFVQFDFPDENGIPYKSSGGKMVWCDILKRDIPKAWNASNILKVSSIIGGGTPKKQVPEYWGDSIMFFTPTDAPKQCYCLETEDSISSLGLQKSSAKLLPKNTTILTARGSVGKAVLCGSEMAMNQSCYALVPKDENTFVYAFFLARNLVEHLRVKASGSVFNSIISADIESTYLAIPDSDLIKKYSAITNPMFHMMETLSKENQELANLRDWLLPMLMNGQVTIGD